MNDDQKTLVCNYRESGMSYGKIASTLGLHPIILCDEVDIPIIPRKPVLIRIADLKAFMTRRIKRRDINRGLSQIIVGEIVHLCLVQIHSAFLDSFAIAPQPVDIFIFQKKNAGIML